MESLWRVVSKAFVGFGQEIIVLLIKFPGVRSFFGPFATVRIFILLLKNDTFHLGNHSANMLSSVEKREGSPNVAEFTTRCRKCRLRRQKRSQGERWNPKSLARNRTTGGEMRIFRGFHILAAFWRSPMHASNVTAEFPRTNSWRSSGCSRR